VIIRTLTAEDCPACARWMAATPLWQHYGVTEHSAQQRLEQGLANQATIAVAEQDGQVLGFVWYVLEGAFARSGYILLIGVQPGRYRQRVGQALMDYAEAQVFQQAADIFLLVSDFNLAAQRFYQRRGYKQVGAIPDYVLPGVSELIYTRRRPASAQGG